MPVRTKYKVFEKQDDRRFKPEIVFSTIITMVFILVLGYIMYDLNRSPTVIDESDNAAVLGEFVSTIERYKPVETATFELEVPEGWVQVNNPENLINGKRYYPTRYQGVTGDDAGRWIEIYEARLPDVPVDKVIGVTASGAGVSVGELSEQCVEFTELEDPEQNQHTQARWNDLSFLCRMSTIGNRIIAVETGPKQGVRLVGETVTDNYLFVFGDHGSSPDNEIFRKILTSFKVK